MMNDVTLRYVLKHADENVHVLALRGCKDSLVDLPLALQQIQGLQTARRKLPSWAATAGILFPPHLNMEQCSSELTARYKSGLTRRFISRFSMQGVPNRLLDLTGGFGVDFSFMADVFQEAVYVERDPSLCALASHNLALLGKKNVTVVCADAITYLGSVSFTSSLPHPPFLLVYMDPARRDIHGARTYALSDCSPDVTVMMDSLLQCSSYVLLKLSPMLDWRKAVADLFPHHVCEVHVVAVDNECKELLLLLDAQDSKQDVEPLLFCVDIHSRDGSSTVYSPQPKIVVSEHPVSAIQNSSFLYEPNASVMKAGCFRELAADFGISQLAVNSHLFISARQVTDFPGRSFRIMATTTMNKRDLRQALGHLQRANIAVRNFPLTAEELRRRLKLADGGPDYIFATTLSNGDHIIMLCVKV